MPTQTEFVPELVGGRNVVITGGSRGLGLAIAHKLASHGAEVTIVDRKEALAEADLPAGWKIRTCDFLADNTEETMAGIAKELAQTDIVVANAGVVPPWRRIGELDMAEWRRVFDVNVTGVAMTLRCFAPVLARRNNATAIVMASLNARRGHPDQALYTASKHAVLGLVRAAAFDLGRDGIRVNAIGPGPIATEALLARIDSRHESGGPPRREALDNFAAETALNRIATPEDVANAALFLASDLSAGITGTLLQVDCGLA